MVGCSPYATPTIRHFISPFKQAPRSSSLSLQLQRGDAGRWGNRPSEAGRAGTHPIRSSNKPLTLLPLLRRPILSSSILKLIRLPASILFQIVPSIKPDASLPPHCLFSEPYTHSLQKCGGGLVNHPQAFFFTLCNGYTSLHSFTAFCIFIRPFFLLLKC